MKELFPGVYLHRLQAFFLAFKKLNNLIGMRNAVHVQVVYHARLPCIGFGNN